MMVLMRDHGFGDVFGLVQDLGASLGAVLWADAVLL